MAASAAASAKVSFIDFIDFSVFSFSSIPEQVGVVFKMRPLGEETRGNTRDMHEHKPST
jgi:hypothetical protein